MNKVLKNKIRKPKVGARVTRLGNDPLRWGTITRVTDLNRPGLKITGLKRYVCRVVWDVRPDREDVVSATYLFYDGDKPVQMSHLREDQRELVDPKRRK